MSSSIQFGGGERVVLVGSGITCEVVSSDSRVIALCRDVLREWGEVSPAGARPTRSDTDRQPKICIWDYDSQPRIPPAEELAGCAVLYLVPAPQIDSLLQSMPSAAGNILLKPVTRVVLRAFLSSVAPPKDLATASEVGTLRANRDDLLQRLLQANLRLQEYDQQRTHFIARAVHDFRAPLTTLSGFCGLLVSGQLGPLNQQQKEALSRMEHSAKRISRMASAMFDLSLGAKVDRKPDLREGDIQDPIKQALHEISPLALEKEILLKFDDITPPGEPLYFEVSLIEQALVNLLDNACKFTHRGGCIELRGYPYFWERRFLVAGSSPGERRADDIRLPNSYRIDIRDTGPGIPANRLDHIFEEYISYAGPQDRSGGGLGLAICRMVIGRHEGRIWAEADESGTTFSFVLPYRQTKQHGDLPRAIPA
jgi:signal transduction histidine kinase